MKAINSKSIDNETYLEFCYFKGEAENPYDWNDSPILFKWWNFEKDYFDNHKQSGQWKIFIEFLNYWIKEKAAPEIGYDLSNGNTWIDEYRSNAPYITLKDYLIDERKSARNEYKKRAEEQEKIIKRYNELSNKIANTENKEQLYEVVKIANSYILILNQLAKDDVFAYLGDVSSYLTNDWPDFSKKWKPDFEQLRDSAKFKAENLSDTNVSAKPNRLSVQGFKDNIPERLTKIHTHLTKKGWIDCNVDIWLYWFNQKELNNAPERIQWKGADTLLTIIIKEMCDNGGQKYIENAFKYKDKYQKQNDMYQTEKSKINGFMLYAMNKI